MLLLISALGAAVGWTRLVWCPPNKSQSTLPLGGSSRGTERSAVHLDWDINICFPVTGAFSLHGRIWIVLGTLSCCLSKTTLCWLDWRFFGPMRRAKLSSALQTHAGSLGRDDPSWCLPQGQMGIAGRVSLGHPW